jgi:ParB family transcriptional regulator, chromosome partitioning protein
MTAQIKNRGLGRGLGALLQDTDNVNAAEKEYNALNPNLLSEIPVAFVETNPYQPRTHFDTDALNELAESIKIQGIIQPITVRQLSANQYQLISGERRLQASKIAGLSTIPAYVRTANDQQMLEMALIENIQRENLNALEIALTYQRMIDELNLKQDELGDRVGKERSTVTNYLRLLKLPAVIQVALRDSTISMGHARALIAVADEKAQIAVFQKAIAEGWSVRKIEEAIKNMQQSLATEAKPKAGNFEIVAEKLSKNFDAKVRINSDSKGKGEIKISFENKQKLSELLHKLGV